MLKDLVESPLKVDVLSFIQDADQRANRPNPCPLQRICLLVPRFRQAQLSGPPGVALALNEPETNQPVRDPCGRGLRDPTNNGRH